jgi:hypothetical protein
MSHQLVQFEEHLRPVQVKLGGVGKHARQGVCHVDVAPRAAADEPTAVAAHGLQGIVLQRTQVPHQRLSILLKGTVDCSLCQLHPQCRATCATRHRLGEIRLPA